MFGAHLDDAMVMDKRPQGWVVFYSERGGEYSLAAYESEADACAEILDRVTRDERVVFELVAGPAPAAEADEAFGAWLNRHGTTLRDIDASDWKTDEVPWAAGPYWRRYFVRITAARRLAATSDLLRSVYCVMPPPSGRH